MVVALVNNVARQRGGGLWNILEVILSIFVVSFLCSSHLYIAVMLLVPIAWFLCLGRAWIPFLCIGRRCFSLRCCRGGAQFFSFIKTKSMTFKHPMNTIFERIEGENKERQKKTRRRRYAVVAALVDE